MTYGNPSPFPPSFEGNPFAYAFGLFGDLVGASLALAMLCAYLFELRRSREVGRRLRSPVSAHRLPRLSLVNINRLKNIGFLTFVVMRALPDALWMLAWGEISEPNIRRLLALDLWGDGLALIPLLMSTFLWAWSKQAVEQQLIEARVPTVQGRPPWNVLWQNGKIVFIVMVIAVGVTLGKASA